MDSPVRIVVLFFTIVVLLTLLSGAVSGDHVTCREGEQDVFEECDNEIDWWDRFDSTPLSDMGASLASENNVELQDYYKQPGLGLNESTHESLINEQLYPYEAHEHVFDEDGDNPQITPGDDTEVEIEFARDADFSTTSSDGEDFNVTTVRTSLHLPEGAEAEVVVRNDDGDRVDSVIFDGEDVDSEIGNHQIVEGRMDSYDFQESPTYDVSVILRRDDPEIENPVIGKHVLLERHYPPFRVDASHETEYPEFDLDYMHRQMFNQYDNRIHSGDVADYVRAPQYPEEEFNNYETETGFSDEEQGDDSWFGQLSSYFTGSGDDGTGEPIRQAYLQVDTIEPSVKVPQNPSESEWDRLVEEEGSVYITYDAARGDTPPDAQDFEGDPSEGDLRWSYNFEDIEFDIEAGYNRQTGPSEASFEEIDGTTTSDSGVFRLDYDEDDIVRIDLISFAASMDVTLTYERDIEEYVPNMQPCPSYSSVEDGLPIECDDELGSGICSYEYNTPEGCSTELDEWQDGLTTEDYDTETVEYEKSLSDSKGVDKFAETDGPDDDDFGVDVAVFPDENRVHVHRDIETETSHYGMAVPQFESTRWTNMQSHAVTREGSVEFRPDEMSNELANKEKRDAITIDTQSSVDETGLDEQALDEEITDDMDVTLNVWAAGDFDSTLVDIELEDEEIDTFTGPSNSDRTQLQQVVDDEDVTDIVQGSEEYIDFTARVIDDDFVDDTDATPKVHYTLTIDVDEPVGEINSRWGYWTFRDTSWDAIYEFEEDCDDEDGCYDYIDHGMPPHHAPDIANPEYPSGIMPVQAHLLPSSDSLETDIIPRQFEYDIDVVDSSVNSIQRPIQSSNCANDIRYEDFDNVCNVYHGYLADDTFEQMWIDGEIGRDSPEDREDIEDDYDWDEGGELDDPEQLRRNSPNEGVFGGDLDFRAIRSDDIASFDEAERFEIRSEDPIEHFTVAGNASWAHEEIQTDSVRPASHTSISIEEVNMTEQFSEDERDELRDMYPSNNQIKEDYQTFSNEVHLRIELTDSDGEPISTSDRDTNENLIVERATRESMDFNVDVAGRDGAGYSYTYENRTVDTNSEGVAYVTVYEAEAHEEDVSANVIFDAEEEWWTLSEDKVVLDRSNYQVMDESGEVEDDEDESGDPSLWDMIFAIFFIVFGFFLALSLAMRTYPGATTTPMELFYVATEPFRDELIQAFIYLMVFVFMIFVMFLFNAMIQ